MLGGVRAGRVGRGGLEREGMAGSVVMRGSTGVRVVTGGAVEGVGEHSRPKSLVVLCTSLSTGEGLVMCYLCRGQGLVILFLQIHVHGFLNSGRYSVIKSAERSFGEKVMRKKSRENPYFALLM